MNVDRTGAKKALVWGFVPLALGLLTSLAWGETVKAETPKWKVEKSYALGSALVEEGSLTVGEEATPIGITIVSPTGVPLRAGLVWGHWLGNVKSDRSQYLQEAVQLASDGLLSVLPDVFWGHWAWYSQRPIDQDPENALRQVRHFQRAVDLLAFRTQKHRVPLGFVGHDYSALYGAPAVAHDPRIRAAVFVAMPSSQYDWAFFRGQPTDLEAYKRRSHEWEPAVVASQFAPRVFLQYAEQDTYISKVQRESLVGLFGAKAKVRVYPSTVNSPIGHSMDAEVIREERRQWLLDQLR